jgi:hypothetical protein
LRGPAWLPEPPLSQKSEPPSDSPPRRM